MMNVERRLMRHYKSTIELIDQCCGLPLEVLRTRFYQTHKGTPITLKVLSQNARLHADSLVPPITKTIDVTALAAPLINSLTNIRPTTVDVEVLRNVIMSYRREKQSA